jgi:hypothetical protein
MARGKKFAKKDPNEGLPDGFREAVAGMSTDEIRRKISDITVLDIGMRQLLDADEKVSSAKEVLKNLMEPYRADFKSFKTQIKVCKAILDDKNGGATSAKLEEEHQAAKEAKRTAGVKDTTIEMTLANGKSTGPILMSEFGKKLDKALDNLKNLP